MSMLDVHLIGGPLDGSSRRTQGGKAITLTVLDEEGVAHQHTYRFLLPIAASRVLAVHEDMNNGQALRLMWEAYVKIHELGQSDG